MAYLRGLVALLSQRVAAFLAAGGLAWGVGCGVDPVLTADAAFSNADVRRCKPADGTTGSPSTIAEAVALANGLPFPLTPQCFVEALDRPLHIEATSSRNSVQPAVGARSPRVLIFSGDALVIAVTVEGHGRDLVEFGQLTSPRRSIKGELAFPLEAPVETADALEQVRNADYPNITRCFVCHDREEDVPSISGARDSLIVRPRSNSLVPVESITDEMLKCDPAAEPERCAWLTAIAGYGPLVHRPFDETLPTF